ncbi:MAG: hypothetical protein WB902_03470, partial [Acetobacteraceae bacterium]
QGSPGHEVYGAIEVGDTPTNQFPLNASLTLTHGVSLSYGNLAIGGDTGGFVALDGASTVTNDSTFLATGGRYLNGPFVLNGSMTVSHGSTADFRHATLEGHGTVNIDTGSVVDMNTVLAGLHVNVAKGSDLLLQGLTGCGNTREIRVFPWSAGVWRTFGVRIYGFLLCCRARIMPRDRLLA